MLLLNLCRSGGGGMVVGGRQVTHTTTTRAARAVPHPHMTNDGAVVDGAALITRIDAADRATLLSRQRVAELEATKKGLQLDLAKLSAVNTRQQQICRELQLATKALGGEGDAEAEAAARRDQLTSKFDGTIGDIGDRMGAQEAEVAQLLAENERAAVRPAPSNALPPWASRLRPCPARPGRSPTPRVPGAAGVLLAPTRGCGQAPAGGSAHPRPAGEHCSRPPASCSLHPAACVLQRAACCLQPAVPRTRAAA